jgi:hydrogenase-4 component B
MQDTAEGFGQPIRQVFEPFFRMERHLPSAFDEEPRYQVRATDRLWEWLYLPIVRAADAVGRLAGLIQRGRIAIYLTYSFLTLLALLFFVR